MVGFLPPSQRFVSASLLIEQNDTLCLSETTTNTGPADSHSSIFSNMKHEDYAVGWICTLPTEMAAAVGMLDEHHDTLPSRPSDNNNYRFGRIGDHNVVIACLPSGVTGTASAARVATHMLSTFTGLRFGLMVGIGGGVPSEGHDIQLGDVVVSKPTGTFAGVIQYDFGQGCRLSVRTVPGPPVRYRTPLHTYLVSPVLPN